MRTIMKKLKAPEWLLRPRIREHLHLHEQGSERTDVLQGLSGPGRSACHLTSQDFIPQAQ